jgi:hypothetical protein
MRGERGGDDADLAAAVELVAREVEQHHHGRIHGGGDRGQVQLVDLEHRHRCVAIGRERGYRAVGHARPRRVVRHRTHGPQSRD